MSEFCKVEGCDGPRYCRGWCVKHYQRWRKTGTTDSHVDRRYEVCTVDGCDQQVRSTFAEYCEMHYCRLRRTGSLADPKQVTGTCIADGCSAPANHSGLGARRATEGYCRKHYLRLKRRGDVDFEFSGDNHHKWTGDDATSPAVHQRLRWNRGKATEYACVDCGGPAKHWSYDRTDPNQRHDPEKGPYSLDLNRYHPRCVRCHKRFDMAHVLRERAS